MQTTVESNNGPLTRSATLRGKWQNQRLENIKSSEVRLVSRQNRFALYPNAAAVNLKLIKQFMPESNNSSVQRREEFRHFVLIFSASSEMVSLPDAPLTLPQIHAVNLSLIPLIDTANKPITRLLAQATFTGSPLTYPFLLEPSQASLTWASAQKEIIGADVATELLQAQLSETASIAWGREKDTAKKDNTEFGITTEFLFNSLQAKLPQPVVQGIISSKDDLTIRLYSVPEGLDHSIALRRASRDVPVGQIDIPLSSREIQKNWAELSQNLESARKDLVTGKGAEVEPAGCFLTTAACEVVGLPDDCWELRTLRRFRDQRLTYLPQGQADIALYYKEGPRILKALRQRSNARQAFLSIYWRWILPCALLAALGADRLCHHTYRAMMKHIALRLGLSLA